MGFLSGTVAKDLPANAGDIGDMGLIPASGRFPGGGNVFLLVFLYSIINVLNYPYLSPASDCML